MIRDKIRAAIAASDNGYDGLGGDLMPEEIDQLTDAVLAALTTSCTCREDVVCGACMSGATNPATAIEYEYTDRQMDGSPDSAGLRAWGSVRPDAYWRRRKAGPWEPNPAAREAQR